MPKPVLSDSLFNADDVATAVLAEANLQITNSNLAVTDHSNNWTLSSGWGSDAWHAYSFNGFMFVSGRLDHLNGTPVSGETCIIINNSDFFPASDHYAPGISYQGDTSEYVKFTTNGEIKVQSPVNVGDSNYFVTINATYRY